jgi:hypothetical protein
VEIPNGNTEDKIANFFDRHISFLAAMILRLNIIVEFRIKQSIPAKFSNKHPSVIIGRIFFN